MGTARLLIFSLVLAWLFGCEQPAASAEQKAIVLPPEAATEFQKAAKALEEGDWETAEALGEKGAAFGGTSSYPLREFLLGSISYSQGEQARNLALQVEAGLPEWDLAIRRFEQALRRFADAAMGMPDGAASRRNAERAWEALTECQRGRAEAAARKKLADPKQKEEPQENEEPKSEGDESLSTEEDFDAEITRELLLNRDLDQVWEKLKEKELEKREVRRRFQTRSAQPGVRDW
ncbi:MAG TPA: hypothetical protein PKA37_01070 [Planctomycetota bacterium]|nr:hypothetical protein [Planctomycetota bacterium]